MSSNSTPGSAPGTYTPTSLLWEMAVQQAWVE